LTKILLFLTVQKQFVVVLKDFKDPECLQRRLDAREKHLKDALEANSNGILNLGGAILDNHEVYIQLLYLH
jgi:hypothetical protein